MKRVLIIVAIIAANLLVAPQPASATTQYHHTVTWWGTTLLHQHTGPARQTYWGESVIVGWHHPAFQLNAWIPTQKMYYRPPLMAPTSTQLAATQSAATGSTWWNPFSWNWLGGDNQGCLGKPIGLVPSCGILRIGLPDWFADKVSYCVHGAVNGFIGTIVSGAAIWWLLSSGLGKLVIGPGGWAVIAITGCVAGITWWH